MMPHCYENYLTSSTLCFYEDSTVFFAYIRVLLIGHNLYFSCNIFSVQAFSTKSIYLLIGSDFFLMDPGLLDRCDTFGDISLRHYWYCVIFNHLFERLLPL